MDELEQARLQVTAEILADHAREYGREPEGILEVCVSDILFTLAGVIALAARGNMEPLLTYAEVLQDFIMTEENKVEFRKKKLVQLNNKTYYARNREKSLAKQKEYRARRKLEKEIANGSLVQNDQ